MSRPGYDIAQLGLFLSLAFILPGFVYITFFIIYFGNIYTTILGRMELNDSVAFLMGLALVGGLLFTSICMSLELFLRSIERFYETKWLKLSNYFPDMRIGRLAEIEAGDKGCLYLYQITGQAIMHFNIGVGVMLMTFIYLIYIKIRDFDASWLSLLIGLITIIANIHVAENLYHRGNLAIESVVTSLS